MTSSQNENVGPYSLPEGALSYPVDVRRLPAKGLTIKLEPDDDIRAKLAAQCDVLSISAFFAQLNVMSWHKDGIRVTGPLNATLVQSCIITLEPVPESISTQIDAVFVPSTSKLAKPKINAETREVIVEAEGDDVPELFELPFLDVGAVAAEFFALELNPYPKAPDADETAASILAEDEEAAGDVKENTFASLAKIRD
ncbi:MAG: DUF177 domain-containing protein [Pseudomonadota bacterium]